MPLRACVENRYRSAVLRPAGDVVTHRHRALLAVGNRPHAACIDTPRCEEAFYGLRTLGTQRNVVFAGAALVSMAFDRKRVAVVLLQPLRLLIQRRNRLRRQLGLIAFEEYAVADIDDEILLATRRRGARHRVCTGAAL